MVFSECYRFRIRKSDKYRGEDTWIRSFSILETLLTISLITETLFFLIEFQVELQNKRSH